MIIVGWSCACAAQAPFQEGNTLEKEDIAVLGDSNTWLGGDDCSDPRGWNYWFCKEIKPHSMRSYARSGATWSHTSKTGRDPMEYTDILSDNNVIYNQVVRLIQEVDSGKQPFPSLIMIAAGTNDAWFPEYRPEEFSLTSTQTLSRDPQELLSHPPSKITSLAGAVRYNILILKARFPDSKIIIMTPLQSIKISDKMLQTVSKIIQDVADGEECGVIRQDSQCPVRSNAERFNRVLTTDGTHTSPEGARRNGQAIANAVRALTFRNN